MCLGRLQTQQICFHSYVLNVNISVAIKDSHLIFSIIILDIIMGGTVSQTFNIWLSLDFMEYRKCVREN